MIGSNRPDTSVNVTVCHASTYGLSISHVHVWKLYSFKNLWAY